MADERLDLYLTRTALAPSRSRAQAMIRAGNVYVNGRQAEKPGQICPADAQVEVRGLQCPYVSRGGLKLEKALTEFSVEPMGFICCDCGASTGGFTDCLLQHGAARVYAIDVGTAQLAASLREDPRVVVMEQTNVRYLQPGQLPEQVDLAVIDVSFISLSLVLPAVRQILRPDHGQILCLIKPQFEAGKAHVGKKGVVREPQVHRRVLEDFCVMASALGFTVAGLTYSPIRGPEGNIEFLGHLTLGGETVRHPEPDRIVAQAHQAWKV